VSPLHPINKTSSAGKDVEEIRTLSIVHGNINWNSHCARYLVGLRMPTWSWASVADYTREAEIRRVTVQSQPGQIVSETLISKIPNIEKGCGEAQVVERLPSKSSNPNTAKKKKKKRVPT
jgi:hypothetical protein